MTTEETVFILGAGASRPYGYPSGAELRKQIYDCFVSDSNSYFKSQRTSHPLIHRTLAQAEEFKDKFYNSSTRSIDLFLARNPEFSVMGKWAIIFRIFAAERASEFREHTRHRNQDWYSYLFERLTDELIKKEDYNRFSKNKVSFITFNYDRSLEHFLYESLLNSFNGINAEEIKKQLTELRFIHVFGQVAGLDWQDFESKIEYKRDISLINIQSLAKSLRIIHEEGENQTLEASQELINKAQKIFFLGFGYAKENLEILKIPQILSREQKVYGTALHFKEKEIESVKGIFPQSSPPYAPTVYIKNVDCLTLLRECL